MYQAHFCFHGIVNDFLPGHRKETSFIYTFTEKTCVKDAVEAIGVPHPEVGFIFVNQEPQSFAYLLTNADTIDVYPVEAYTAFPGIPVLTAPFPAEKKFILDVHLGKLSRLLRLLGFDTLYQNDFADDQIAAISAAENRIILTRDIPLLKRKVVQYGYWMRNVIPEQQLNEVALRFHLMPDVEPFCRCMDCNGLLREVAKADVLNVLPPLTQQAFTQFYQCTTCKKVYWKGSHYEKMQQLIAQLQADEKNRKDR